MTGEMFSIDQDGNDSNGDTWDLHAAIAQAIGGQLHPFDVYQGPYISVGPDLRVGDAPYAMPVQHLGLIRLWVSSDDGVGTYIYREDTDESSESFFMGDHQWGIDLALSLLGRTA